MKTKYNYLKKKLLKLEKKTSIEKNRKIMDLLDINKISDNDKISKKT